jgi:hypothetical protein
LLAQEPELEPGPKPEPKALEEVGMVLYLHLDLKKDINTNI